MSANNTEFVKNYMQDDINDTIKTIIKECLENCDNSDGVIKYLENHYLRPMYKYSYEDDYGDDNYKNFENFIDDVNKQFNQFRLAMTGNLNNALHDVKDDDNIDDDNEFKQFAIEYYDNNSYNRDLNDRSDDYYIAWKDIYADCIEDRLYMKNVVNEIREENCVKPSL